MNEWYYARGGQQSGPVTFEKLQELSVSGGLDPKDLVWTSTMKDWLPGSQVAGLFQATAAPAVVPTGVPAADPSNPYAAPDSSWNEVARATAGEALSEIVHGSEPIDVGACLKRAFELTKRNAVLIILVLLVYIGISFGLNMITQVITSVISLAASSGDSSSQSAAPGILLVVVSLVMMVFNQAVSIFLSLGITRIGLNLISGKEATVGLLFSEGPKLLKAFGASILYGLMVAVGLILFIVPGIYLAIRYGQFLAAIVDRDMDVMDAFSYSSSLTTNNRMQLFLVYLLGFGLTIAGILALCIGIFVAIPIVMLMNLVAYRWMQYGHRATLDHNGTTVPMLAKI